MIGRWLKLRLHHAGSKSVFDLQVYLNEPCARKNCCNLDRDIHNPLSPDAFVTGKLVGQGLLFFVNVAFTGLDD